MRLTTRPNDAPASLLTKGVVEQHDAGTKIQAYLTALANTQPNDKPPKKPSIPFKMYKDDEVKQLLLSVFAGKCAYCESSYSSTQPMDVEHFRPKGAVNEDSTHPGYYWLAATWTNLLPSCIDCNRQRTHLDVVLEDDKAKLGKKDQFPVIGRRAKEPADDLEAEKALLLDPTIEDPAKFLRFDRELGIALPRSKTGARRQRALESIRIYGLNRSGLVTDRLHIIRQIDHHLLILEKLGVLRQNLATAGTTDLRGIVDEVIVLELQALFALADPARPHAGMARQLLDELAPTL